MAYEVQVRETARKQIRNLPEVVQVRVLAKVEQLADQPRMTGSVTATQIFFVCESATTEFFTKFTIIKRW